MLLPVVNDASPATAAVRLRALAHPVRWKLIDVVSAEGSATATRCADVLGESVASCSYHLGILGKYGYLERVPDAPGREKPWRVTSRLQDDLSASEDDAEARPAGEAAAAAFLDHELEQIKDRMRRQNSEPVEWQAAHLIGGATMYVTASELSRIKDELTAILHRFAERADDPGLRPDDARSARIFVSASVDPQR